ncbi:hypothetical protein [Methylobacterium trifolii]|uniref:Uncharacterized protein n=1 Tax=Methylobacterium trifolii TaxID=1003092 RepID=A0ABQ4U0X3_9HYPH|nr:hypothetical protein [Methylobacterium trifolii]GJE60926.1 hypothetical protein MPOCJGCO_3045 [Methylobacterium trifolii]
MATRMMIKGMSVSDRFVAWAMTAGMAVALVQLGQAAALPAHFV